MEKLKFWDRFTLLAPNTLESYQWFYMSCTPSVWKSSEFTVIWVLEKEYIIAKNLNASFRPEYDTIKDSFIIKLLECWKVVFK